MFAHASLNLFTTFLAKYKEMGEGGGGGGGLKLGL